MEETNNNKTITDPDAPKYLVYLLNDNYTPMDFVIELLQEFFNKPKEDASSLMYDIHWDGEKVVGIYSEEIALKKCELVRKAAFNKGFPLKTRIEKKIETHITNLTDLYTLKKGNYINHRQVIRTLYGNKPDDFFNKASLPQVKSEDEYSIEFETNVIDDLEVEFSIKKYIGNSRVIRLIKEYTEKKIGVKEDGEVFYIHESKISFKISTKEDLLKIKDFIPESVGTVIYRVCSSIEMTVYFSEDSFNEAGVELFGNNGDSTFDNAYYWKKGEESPFYNKGWMLWGCLDFNESLNSMQWFPLFNDEVFDWQLEYYSEKYQIDNPDMIKAMKKDFILHDNIAIKARFMELGILFDRILEY